MSDTTILNPTDDPLTQIRHTLEGIRTNQADALTELGTKISTFGRKFDEYEARLVEMEDKGKNPYNRFWQSSHSSREERQQLVSRWVQDAYRSTDPGWATTPSGIQWRADQKQSDDSKGGYLVPTPLYPEVLRIIGEFGVARGLCRVLPMSRTDMDISRKNAGPTVSWPAEGVAPSTTSTTFGTVKLAAKTMMALDEVSLELKDDSALDLASYLIDIFSEAVAEEEDKQAFNSTAPFTGLCQNTDIGVHTLASTTFTGNLTYNDFVSLMAKPDKNVRMRGTFLFSSDVFAEIQKIKDTTGRPLFNPGLSGDIPANILGRPFVVSHVMPGYSDDSNAKPVAAYGDFRRYLLGDRRTLTVDFSPHAAWNSAAESMRVLERVAFVCGIPAAFALMKTKA